MKEDMYTYHYFKNKSIMKPSRLSEYFFEGVLVSGFAFALIILLQTLR